MYGWAARRIEAVRWDYRTARAIRGGSGILVTDRLRYPIASPLEDSTDPNDFLLTGHGAGPETEARFGYHAHAHWWWVEDSGGNVAELAAWVPAGLAPPQRDRVLAVKRLTTPSFRQRVNVTGDLQVTGVGSAADVLSDLGGGAISTVWRSAVPYLLTRHTKPSRDWGGLVEKDVQSYLDYYQGRGAVRLLGLQFRAPNRPYRTTRWNPRDEPSRAIWIDRMETDVPLTGPVCLGRHSHFGFGRFIPDEGAYQS